MVHWITLFSTHKLPAQLTSISHWHESVNILITYYPLTHSHLISRLSHTIILSPFWYLLRKSRETTERRIRDYDSDLLCSISFSIETTLSFIQKATDPRRLALTWFRTSRLGSAEKISLLCLQSSVFNNNLQVNLFRSGGFCPVT